MTILIIVRRMASNPKSHARYDELAGQIEDANANVEILAGFIRQLEKVGAEATEFSEEAWGGLINRMTVYAKDNIEVTFIGGFSVTVR